MKRPMARELMPCRQEYIALLRIFECQFDRTVIAPVLLPQWRREREAAEGYGRAFSVEADRRSNDAPRFGKAVGV